MEPRIEDRKKELKRNQMILFTRSQCFLLFLCWVSLILKTEEFKKRKTKRTFPNVNVFFDYSKPQECEVDFPLGISKMCKNTKK
eukprot:m.28698 g.28698  ORF g.28698 m.28698 type:complete len:84 (-) comp15957_c0_seq3:209-460(-)